MGIENNKNNDTINKNTITDLLSKAGYEITNGAKISDGWKKGDFEIINNKGDLIKNFSAKDIQNALNDPWFSLDDMVLDSLIKAGVIDKKVTHENTIIMPIDNREKDSRKNAEYSSTGNDTITDLLSKAGYKITNGAKISDGWKKGDFEIINNKGDLIKNFSAKDIQNALNDPWFSLDDMVLDSLIKAGVIEKI